MWKKRYGSTGIASLIMVMTVLAALAPAALAQLRETKIVASDGADEDYFGEAVDIDGDRFVVGVRTADIGNDENAGAAYVYKRIDGQWQEVQKLVASNGNEGHFFGESVAIDGDWILVGALGNDDRGGNGSGAVYVFEYNDSLWQEVQILYPDDAATGKFFGWEVALDGTRAAVGGPRDDEIGIQAGAVYLFERENGEWVQDDKLVPSSDLSSFFGTTLGLDGDRIIIGSPTDREAGDGAGAAYVFEFLAGRWQLFDKLLPPPQAPPDSVENDTFGREVALNGDWAFVGSGDDEQCIDEMLIDPEFPNACTSGAVFAYQRQSDDDWELQQKIAPEELEQFDTFGFNAIAIEGNRAVVGSRGDDDACPDPPPPTGLFCDTGAVYLFELMDDEWQQTNKLTAADADSTDFLAGNFFGQGRPVGISGSHVIAGAPTRPFNENPKPDLGAAYIFKIFNRDPVAQDDQATTSRNTPVDIGVLRNDSDPDFDELTITVIAGPSNGSVSIGDSTINYTPSVGFSGIDALTYEVDDGDGGTAQANVTINVAAPTGGAPSAPAITSPADGAELTVGGDAQNPGNPNDPFEVTWTESTDPDGDEINYTWQLAVSDNFALVLFSQDTGSETRFETTLGTIDALLAQAGVDMGAGVTLFHRAVASDGQNTTPGAAAEVRLIRGVLTATEDQAEVPDRLVLSSNYPNPFNPETRISFGLPQSSAVRLSVFDVLGREVAVLVDERLGAGRHEAVFVADDLPSGLYVYQLRTVRQTLARTMLLLK